MPKRTYREYIYDICSSVDPNSQESVTLALQVLAKEAVRYQELCMKFDEKLKELMPYKDFVEMSAKIGKEMFRQDIEEMPDGDFKDFVLENMDRITDDPEKGDGDEHDDVCSE